MGRKQRATWRKLTRKDLAAFDDYAVKAIVYAMDHGGLGKISNRGHAMLKSPAGEIMGVAADTRKARQVIAITLRKHYGNGGLDEIVEEAEQEPEVEVEEAQREPTLECTAKGCEAVFVTEGARYSHVHEKHHVCEHPGCLFASDFKQAVASHHRIIHLGIKPRAGKTKAVMERRRRSEAGKRAAATRAARREASDAQVALDASAALAPASAALAPEPASDPAPAITWTASFEGEDPANAILTRLDQLAVRLMSVERDNARLRAALAAAGQALWTALDDETYVVDTDSDHHEE